MYRKEQLYFSVPYSHPLAKKDKVSFQDIDGQNILLFSKIGFWLETCKKYLPNAHFLMMDEEEAFGNVIGSAAFPFFTSDYFVDPNFHSDNLKLLPITDDFVSVSYYCICKEENYPKFQSIFHSLEQFDTT